MTELRGMWPGGPSEESDADATRGRPRRLRTMEERSSARSDARRRRSRLNRGARVLFGFVGAVVVAGLLGWALGVQARRTQQELIEEKMAESRREATGIESLVEEQSNKIIQQMWLTELMDAQRGR